MTKIWVDNFYWDVVSACDTAGTSCCTMSCSVFIETLGLDFFIKADNDFRNLNFKTLIFLNFDKKKDKTLGKSENGISPKPYQVSPGKMGFSKKWDFGPNFSSLKDKMGSHFIANVLQMVQKTTLSNNSLSKFPQTEDVPIRSNTKSTLNTEHLDGPKDYFI